MVSRGSSPQSLERSLAPHPIDQALPLEMEPDIRRERLGSPIHCPAAGL